MFGDALAIRLYAGRAADHERAAAFRQQLDGFENVVKDDRLENVQLKVALRSGEGHGVVVAVDLDGDHGQCLRLGWVNLAGHDGGTRFVIGYEDFADARAGAGGVPADVVGDLHESAGESAQSGAQG